MMRNIAALRERRAEEERSAGLQDRIADVISQFAGSLTFVAIHLVLVIGWIVVNLGWTSIEPYDPSFVILATFASVEAIFLSTFVLISQNRAATEADRRAELDLQVNLLAEHEVTRMLDLTVAIARHLGLPEAQDSRLSELKRDVAPEKVLDKLEETEEQKEKQS
jgi:uncharacterized membrane protein